jgi:hypothetical protein
MFSTARSACSLIASRPTTGTTSQGIVWTLVWMVGCRSGGVVVAGAHRLVAGEHGTHDVDGGVAELGGCGD